MKARCVLGLDLAGVSHRPTGVCLLRGSRVESSLLYSDQELLDYAARSGPELLAIDAPLTLPPGRRSIHDRNSLHLRPCDEELRRRGIPFFPITLGPMRSLTERGIRLRQELERMGMAVVEIYPGGAQDLWGIPRARRDPGELRRGLAKLGLRGLRPDSSDHELDAATGALVGRLFLEGRAEVYGDLATGVIVMPVRLAGS